MVDINVGAISEALNDKLDRNGMNTASPCAVVIKSFVDGANGYRIWSDGYCEQWGRWLNTGTVNTATITLEKTYNSKDYNISTHMIFAANGNSYNPVTLYNNPTENSFTVYNASMNAVNRGFYWRTCGILADGQY